MRAKIAISVPTISERVKVGGEEFEELVGLGVFEGEVDLVEEVVKDVEGVEDGLDCELEGVDEDVGVDPELEDGDVEDAMVFSEVNCCSAGG